MKAIPSISASRAAIRAAAVCLRALPIRWTRRTHGIVLRGGSVRRLMPRECFRLQGFSEDQIDKILAINSDAQAYKQAGNSVTVTVIEAIGRRIRAADAELHDKEEGRDVCPTM